MLRNLPIRRKLILISMLTSGVAVLAVCIIFAIYDVLALRQAMVDDMTATTSIIADNSASALAFDDPESAAQTLRSLATYPHIVGAAVYDNKGVVFATYRNAHGLPFVPPSRAASVGHHFEDDALRVSGAVNLSGEVIGTVYLQSSLAPIHERMRRYALVVMLVVIGAGGISLLLSTTLQTTISTPILQLAEVARRVAADKNYRMRVTPAGNDELGKLVVDFNEMLNEIQSRDEALQHARDELEMRVEARTQELANSLSLLSATLESSSDGIIAYPFDGQPTCWNERYRTMWNMPEELLKSKDSSDPSYEWIAAACKDPAKFKARADALIKAQVTEAFDVLELRDGRIIERYIRPQKIGDTLIGVVITYRDITERRRAEQELETAHKRLLETSRRAGMAEVATGVLHNVGNVLNSVNVSANLISDHLKNSKVSGLVKAATMLHKHKHDLATFMASDAQGKHLPAYLIQLAEYLPKEQHTVLAELEGLRENIGHIKQIVTMQQTYSKVSGVKEMINMADLIEDSLRMNNTSLTRHGVEVIRDYAKVPEINAEKHKILQILINLIGNAKYACNESGKTDKRVTLRLRNDDSHLIVDVIDNGIGIAPDNLTRIFSHGFTTRKDGHGFGLHSGAIAARELGGSLRASSPGPGMGATFTLELPLELAAMPV